MNRSIRRALSFVLRFLLAVTAVSPAVAVMDSKSDTYYTGLLQAFPHVFDNLCPCRCG